jgi:hypothetical protein
MPRQTAKPANAGRCSISPLAPPARSPSPSRGRHAHPRSRRIAPRLRSRMSGTAAAISCSGIVLETLPAAPAAWRSSPASSIRSSAIHGSRHSHTAGRTFPSCPGRPAPRCRDYSARPPPAPRHTPLLAPRSPAPAPQASDAPRAPRTTGPLPPRSPAPPQSPHPPRRLPNLPQPDTPAPPEAQER